MKKDGRPKPECPAWLDDLRFDPFMRALLEHVLRRVHKSGVFYEQRETTGAWLGISDRSVRRAMQRLEACNVLKPERYASRGRKATSYVLCPLAEWAAWRPQPGTTVRVEPGTTGRDEPQPGTTGRDNPEPQAYQPGTTGRQKGTYLLKGTDASEGKGRTTGEGLSASPTADPPAPGAEAQHDSNDPPTTLFPLTIMEPEVVDAKVVSWSQEAGEMWERAYGGVAPFGKIGKYLKPLVDRDTWEGTRPCWQRYLDEKDIEYASPKDFAEKAGTWAPGVSHEGASRKKTVAERNRDVIGAYKREGEPGHRPEDNTWAARTARFRDEQLKAVIEGGLRDEPKKGN
jgi:hypothetical protein